MTSQVFGFALSRWRVLRQEFELAGVWLVAGRRILAGYDRADRAERVG